MHRITLDELLLAELTTLFK